MLNIEKLIKYHDFPKEGTLSKVRLNVVKESVEKNNEKTEWLLYVCSSLV